MKIQTAEKVFVIGIFADLITTVVGLDRGLHEGHPAGENGVFLANFIVLLWFFLIHEKVRGQFQKFFKISYVTVGTIRFIVALWNIYLILRYTI